MKWQLHKKKIFGPVLVIIPFENETEAISIANDSPYGLAAYIQTGSATRAERVSSRCMLVPFILMVVASIMAHRLVAINNRAMAAKAD